MFERESRREKILEAKMREMRLKSRTKPADLSPALGGPQGEVTDKVNELKIIEEEFFNAVKKVGHKGEIRQSYNLLK